MLCIDIIASSHEVPDQFMDSDCSISWHSYKGRHNCVKDFHARWLQAAMLLYVCLEQIHFIYMHAVALTWRILSMALYISAEVMTVPSRLTASRAASFITFASSAPGQHHTHVANRCKRVLQGPVS